MNSGEDQVTLSWLATRLQALVDLHPDFDVPVDRLATDDGPVTLQMLPTRAATSDGRQTQAICKLGGPG